MPLHAQMTLVDVLARNGAQVLVAGVLVQPLPHLRPADLVIKFAYLLFGVIHAFLAGTGCCLTLLVIDYFHVNGSPTRNLNVSPNCAIPSPLSTLSTGQISRSSQKFIRRQGNGRGYSKKKR